MVLLLEWFRRRFTNDARRAHGDGARATFDADAPSARDASAGEDDSDEGGGFDAGGSFDEHADESGIDPFALFPEPVRIEITDIFDLHTIAPRDVKRAVEAYLEEAHRARLPSVRIIHGKGRGVQREMVRKILACTPFVLDWTDAPPQAGGLGATVAHLATMGDE